MKKVLSVVLALAMVLAVASFAAAATLSYTGNVNAEFNTIDYLANGYGDTWLTVDYTKDLTEGWSAGIKFNVKPGQSAAGDAVGFDGKGYVKYTAELWDVSFKTGYDNAVGQDLKVPGVAHDLVVEGVTFVTGMSEGKLPDNPSVELNFKPVEGLTLTADILDEPSTKAEHTFDYLFQGVYDLNGFKVGAGYSSLSYGTSNSDDDFTIMGVFGSYKIMDILTIGAEYQARSYVNALGERNDFPGYRVNVGYSQDAITANLTYFARSAGVWTKDDGSGEMFSLADRFRDMGGFLSMTNLPDKVTDTRYLISVDGSYALSDTMKVGALFETTDAKFQGIKHDGSKVTDVSTGYKVYLSDTIVPNLTLEGGYQAFIDGKIYVKLSANIGGATE